MHLFGMLFWLVVIAVLMPPVAHAGTRIEAVTLTSLGRNSYRVIGTDQVITTRQCGVRVRKQKAIIYWQGDDRADDRQLIFLRQERFCEIAHIR